MAYCTQADIENLFGTDNVRVWSNLANDAETADTDRIGAAIGYAEAHLNRRLRRSKYTIPLSATSSDGTADIADLAARLAGVWLYESRGIDEQDANGRPYNRMDLHRLRAERTINRLLSGQDTLAASLAVEGIDAPAVVG